MMDLYDFGELLRTLRREKGYSQAQLSQKINKSKATISRYESNQKMPPLDTLVSLASLYNVSLDYLVGLDKKRSLFVEGLSEAQIQLLQMIVAEFHERPLVARDGLTKRQQEILNMLLIEFNRGR